MTLKSEVSAGHEMYLSIGQVAPECLGSSRNERRVAKFRVLTVPNTQNCNYTFLYRSILGVSCYTLKRRKKRNELE